MKAFTVVELLVVLAIIGILLAILATGCQPVADTPVQAIQNSGRFRVDRVGVIDDDLAYNHRRGIYIIRDTETETEYFGVSGIGISELGSHTQSAGKTTTTVQDER